LNETHSMNVLLIGSGGREHALAWALRKSPLLDRLYCAPGNGGIAALAECVALDPLDFAAVTDFVRAHDIGFVIVGPEAPLVAGLVDHLFAAGIMAFGPTAAAARLEGSKGFTKDLCAANAIPTAAYARFSDAAAAKIYIRQQGAPIVIKADGLAAGKGVILAETLAEAEAAVDDILGGAFGAAGAELVVEEFLYGEEASFFVLVDGKTALPLATAQDHKRVGDGDMGPNTGGMGAYSPAPVVTAELHARVLREVMEPTVRGLQAEGEHYVGFLYAGLMIAADGTPRVLEFNCRFGDPETQPVLMRLRSDLVDLILAALEGRLDGIDVRWDSRVALGVVMAAGGYPGTYNKGDAIAGLPADDAGDVKVFHAGTAERDGKVLTSGGRVLCVTALGATVAAAQARAYEVVRRIRWRDVHYRTDIGYRAIARTGS